MKTTFAIILTTTILAASTIADNSITFGSLNYDMAENGLTCSTTLMIDGYFISDDAAKYTYGLAISEDGTDVGTGDAKLLYNQTSTPGGGQFPGIFHFDKTMLDLNYDSLYENGKLSIDRSKTYNVYSFLGPGDIQYFENGKFLDSSKNEVDTSKISTNGREFPPSDKATVKFDPAKCSDSQLPATKST